VSEAPTSNASPLTDYAELLRALSEAGLETIVVGGCAVGAYARLIGATVISQDLDLLATQTTLDGIVADAAGLGLTLEALPRPRTLPVAVFRWRGREVNVLTQSDGMPTPDVEGQVAREFRATDDDPFTILVADPFDLLRNKLAVNRPKDQPHIALLRQFIEEELVAHFSTQARARDRLAPVVRYIDILGSSTLELELARRLIPAAKTVADFRMLAHRIPIALASDLQGRAPEETIEAAIATLLAARRRIT